MSTPIQLETNPLLQKHPLVSHSSSTSSKDDLTSPSSSSSKFGYKGKDYMSARTLNTIEEEVMREKNAIRKASMSSDGISKTNLESEFESTRRDALYASLPFVAFFGMTQHEKHVKSALSASTLSAMEDMQDTTDKEERHNELAKIDVDEIVLTFPLLMAVFVAVLAQFLVGYNTGVMNAPANVVFVGHSTAEWSWAVSAFAIGGPLGAMLGGLVANDQGRRGAIMINIYIFLLGGIYMTLAPSIYDLILARFVIGFASGLASVVVPVYLGEIAPPTLRGTLGTCTQFAVVIGILMSDVLAYPFGTLNGWRYMVAITPLICALQLAISPFLLESPKWLLSRDEECLLARVVVKQLRAYRSDAEVEEEIGHFEYATSSQADGANGNNIYMELLRAKHLHILVISAIVLQMSQQLCGINAVFCYSTAFFEGVIESPLLGSTLVAFINVIATYIALLIMDTTERRTLLLFSAGGMFVSAMFIILALLGYFRNIIALVAVMAYVSFFEIGLGPIPWLIVAEMFDAKYVATAMSMSSIVNWGCNFLVGLLFPYMQQSLGPWSFGPFSIVLILTIAYTYYILPETYGRSVEDVRRLVNPPDIEFIKVMTQEEQTTSIEEGEARDSAPQRF